MITSIKKKRILYISPGNKPDYQCDMLFHGLSQLAEKEIIELIDVNKIPFLYNTYTDLHTLYGKGFTIYGLLDDIDKDRSDIESKIKKRYFDIVIYGSIRRCSNFIQTVLQNYNSKEICFVDGEDDISINSLLIGRGIYFKRELVNNSNYIFPISFGIPQEKILINDNKNVIKTFAYIDPRDTQTYIYNNETEYYNDYRTSLFGITIKKAGWDALRHYEIIANSCLPLFLDIADCPPLTLFNFPKFEVYTALDSFNSNFKNKETINFDHYFSLLNDIRKVFIKQCTTESIAQYVLNKMESLQ